MPNGKYELSFFGKSSDGHNCKEGQQWQDENGYVLKYSMKPLFSGVSRKDFLNHNGNGLFADDVPNYKFGAPNKTNYPGAAGVNKGYGAGSEGCVQLAGGWRASPLYYNAVNRWIKNKPVLNVNISGSNAPLK